MPGLRKTRQEDVKIKINQDDGVKAESLERNHQQYSAGDSNIGYLLLSSSNCLPLYFCKLFALKTTLLCIS
jgi:hypothetical protein